MTVLFMDGMDLHGVTANIVRRYDVVSSSVSYGAAFGRFGGGGIKVTDDDRFFIAPVVGSPQTAIISFHLFRSSAATAGNDRVLRIQNSGATSGLIFFSLGGSINIQVFRGTATLLGTFPVSLDVWHWISIKAKMANTGGTVDVEVDGVNVFSFSGDTVNSGSETVEAIAFGADRTQDFTYDDVIITDDAGAAPFNTILAQRRIDTILPNATGDSAGFTANPAVDNFLNVDEAVPDDDTTFVEAEPSGTKDLYNMASMNFSPASIDGVNVVALATNPDSGTTQFKLKIKTGTTEDTGNDKAPPLGYTIFDSLFLSDPDTAAAWTESGVNGMQAGMEISS